MMALSKKKCVPCEGRILPLTLQDVERRKADVPEWLVAEGGRSLTREFTFKNFAEALTFANKIGEVAEAENHHPDLHVSWGKVRVDLSTHSIGGLSENDFILASKIDQLPKH